MVKSSVASGLFLFKPDLILLWLSCIMYSSNALLEPSTELNFSA